MLDKLLIAQVQPVNCYPWFDVYGILLGSNYWGSSMGIFRAIGVFFKSIFTIFTGTLQLITYVVNGIADLFICISEDIENSKKDSLNKPKQPIDKRDLK